MPPLHRLFVYGTLRDPEIRARVIGDCPKPARRVLPGYALREADGYYFVRPSRDARVEGELLVLDDAQLRRADRWEDVPVYQRVRVRVDTPDGARSERAWVYVRHGIDGRPVIGAGIAGLPRERILRALSSG